MKTTPYPFATPIAELVYTNTAGVVYVRRTRGNKRQFCIAGPSLPEAIKLIRPTGSGNTFEWHGDYAAYTIAVS